MLVDSRRAYQQLRKAPTYCPRLPGAIIANGMIAQAYFVFALPNSVVYSGPSIHAHMHWLDSHSFYVEFDWFPPHLLNRRPWDVCQREHSRRTPPLSYT